MLLEREQEIATLDEFVSGAGKPGPRLGLIEGPAGIGKSTLLAEARRLAESDGMRVLTARGSTIEAEFPYGVVRQLFEPALAEPGARERAFEGAAEAARGVFEVSATGDDPDAAGFATLHGLYWLTLNLAGEEPLLLAIDDLHWVDHPSLRFIAYLDAAPRGAPGDGRLGGTPERARRRRGDDRRDRGRPAHDEPPSRPPDRRRRLPI